MRHATKIDSVDQTDHEMLKSAYLVFVDFLQIDEDERVTRIDSRGALDAIADLFPKEPPDTIIVLFKRSAALNAALNDAFDAAPQLFSPSPTDLFDAAKLPDRVYALAAREPVSEYDDGAVNFSTFDTDHILACIRAAQLS